MQTEEGTRLIKTARIFSNIFLFPNFACSGSATTESNIHGTRISKTSDTNRAADFSKQHVSQTKKNKQKIRHFFLLRIFFKCRNGTVFRCRSTVDHRRSFVGQRISGGFSIATTQSTDFGR